MNAIYRAHIRSMAPDLTSFTYFITLCANLRECFHSNIADAYVREKLQDDRVFCKAILVGTIDISVKGMY